MATVVGLPTTTVFLYWIATLGETADVTCPVLDASCQLVRGHWWPEQLPTSVRDVRAQTDIDTGEMWANFKLGSLEAVPLLESMQQVRSQEMPRVGIRPAEADWWPGELAAPLSAEALARRGLALHRFGECGYLALDSKTTKVYVYNLYQCSEHVR